MATLYELTGEYARLCEAPYAIDDDTGEVHERDSLEFRGLLEGLAGDVQAKVDGCCKALRNIEADIAGFKAEEKRLAAKRKALENQHTHLREYVRDSMQAGGVKKLKTELFSVSLGKPTQMVEVLGSGTLIPKKYRKVTETFDKAAMRKALLAGEEIENVRLVDGHPKLTIR